MVMRPDLMDAAMANPVSLAFVVEALLLVGVLAYLFTKWGVSRLSWPWFVGLSLLGSMAFATPVVLLARRRVEREREDRAPGPGISAR